MMKYKIVVMIASILSFFNGAFFIFAPVFSLSLLGGDTNPTGLLSTRFFGACALGLAIITWRAKDVKYPEVRLMVSVGMATTLVILAAIDLNGVLTGAIDKLGWLLFAVDFSLSLAFILSIFTDRGIHH